MKTARPHRGGGAATDPAAASQNQEAQEGESAAAARRPAFPTPRRSSSSPPRRRKERPRKPPSNAGVDRHMFSSSPVTPRAVMLLRQRTLGSPSAQAVSGNLTKQSWGTQRRYVALTQGYRQMLSERGSPVSGPGHPLRNRNQRERSERARSQAP